MFRAYYQKLLNLSMIDNIMRTNSFQSHHIAKMHQKIFVINVKPENCSRVQEKTKNTFSPSNPKNTFRVQLGDSIFFF